MPKGCQAAGGLIIAVLDHPWQTFRLIELEDIGYGICADLKAPRDHCVLDPFVGHRHDQKPVLEPRLDGGIIKNLRKIDQLSVRKLQKDHLTSLNYMFS